MGFHIGCQTITWGENQRERFSQVFDDVVAAGYEGVEIGFRHVRGKAANELRKMLDNRGLRLAAIHIGGSLLDPAQADSERRIIDEVLDYLNAVGCSLIIYSGLRYVSDGQFDRDFDILNRTAEKCQSQGVRFLYHNHNWEFADDGRVIQALLSKSSDALGFCPDIGWVMKGGWNILEFLNRTKGRIGAVHFKDFATRSSECDTVILGTGIAPLAEAADWIKKNTQDIWIIAEQDRADIPPSEAAKSNAAYLKGIFGKE
ncbi:MAG: sugar phosphate isomerase/epimerase [Armatimonadota bacterium]|nr:sugar phosphate isomerase/epimerase [Armatimonadota bacterium]